MPEVVPLAKQPVKKSHLWLMNSYDVVNQLDCTAYPGLTLAEMLSLPTWEVIKRHSIT